MYELPESGYAEGCKWEVTSCFANDSRQMNIPVGRFSDTTAKAANDFGALTARLEAVLFPKQ